ncbi:MAG TPA: glucose-1-phosphate thymidylyltransferase RfbA [Allosphingosinicella sp.]|jgi:glucose-1-phosphate thymidylyltransferase
MADIELTEAEPSGRPVRKGIVLAGGTGLRLHPITSVVSKQLMPVYDKPMIYYPLSVLLMAGIREILIITTPRDARAFEALLGDGSKWGVQFAYARQPEPAGIAQALLIGSDFLCGSPSALILGDNLFYGHDLAAMVRRANGRTAGATIFGYHVADPERYGVVAFGPDGSAQSLAEKPEAPQSSYAVTGLYFYDERAVDYAREITPSARGELEITDINRKYLEAGELTVELMGSGYTWLDTGTHESLLDAAVFTRIIEQRQGLKICCPEEVAWRMGYISEKELVAIATPLRKSGYGEYLLSLLDGERRR